MEQILDTRLATLERISPQLVVIQYKPGVVIDAIGIREIIDVRRARFGQDPYAVIAIVPESADFNMSMLETDHYTEGSENDMMRVLATVVEDDFHRRMTELYASYHPTDFHYKVFSQLQPAMIWAEEMLAEHAADPSAPSSGKGGGFTASGSPL